MSSAWKKGQDKYLKFMAKEKKKGKSHAEALTLWKESRSSSTKSKSVSVAKKPKTKVKRKRASGFSRPTKLWDKIHVQTHRQRINIGSVKKRY